MGKVITPNPMIGRTISYIKNGERHYRTIVSEKMVSNQRLYYVSDPIKPGLLAVDADTYDRNFKTPVGRICRKIKGKSIVHRRRA